MATDWSPYRYGFNNQLKYTDPTGMFEYVRGGYGELIESGKVFTTGVPPDSNLALLCIDF